MTLKNFFSEQYGCLRHANGNAHGHNNEEESWMKAGKSFRLAILAGILAWTFGAHAEAVGADVASAPFNVVLSKQANGFLAVTAHLNGVEGRFLLDSGAAKTCVDRKQAARFALQKPGEAQSSHGSAGVATVVQIAGNHLEWAGRPAADGLKVYLTDFGAINQELVSEGVEAVDGVIGMDVLAAQKVVLNYAQGQLNVGGKAKAAATDGLPLHALGGLQLMIDGAVNGVPGRFIIDSAAEGGLSTDEAHAARFGLARQDGMDRVSGIGGSVASQVYSADSLSVGPSFTLRQQKVLTMDLTGVNGALKAKGLPEVDGLLGADILNKGQAVFDIGAQTLRLQSPR